MAKHKKMTSKKVPCKALPRSLFEDLVRLNRGVENANKGNPKMVPYRALAKKRSKMLVKLCKQGALRQKRLTVKLSLTAKQAEQLYDFCWGNGMGSVADVIRSVFEEMWLSKK